MPREDRAHGELAALHAEHAVNKHARLFAETLKQIRSADLGTDDELTQALYRLEEARMWACRAIEKREVTR